MSSSALLTTIAHIGALISTINNGRRVGVGGRLLNANILQADSECFVAVECMLDDGRQVIYYAVLLLCFQAKYLGVEQELCYVRWLHNARALAWAAGRLPTAAETRGVFRTFRWDLYTRVTHPCTLAPSH